ncbi:hypothetical protein K7640_10175 [Micromonospora sp. PLK6-60]|uniref:hypothetical protein n=1 Tax=Micromonospora sp. PLK6-60 TaxID=2873383 RepID=UPI001CA7AA83|nr:hypothetical protein [Micromonospora sp. PLK6-60]MBY8872206.1 hypothetical protein [Micromonospora sp. PLK6-60]
MSVRRHVARLATACALLGGLVAVGASPALADDDSVRVRAAGSFTAGGSAESVTLEVRKKSDGCVLVHTALGLRLDGLSAGQVEVKVNYGGRWWPVPVGDGGDGVQTGRTTPSKPRLCKDKKVTVKYRVAFLAGAPAGRLTVVGEATDAGGEAIDRGSDTARVVGGRAVEPTPTREPTPTPSAVATVEPTAAAVAAPTAAAAVGPQNGRPVAQEEDSGFSPIMFVGLALVLVGAGLIALLVRRSRADRAEREQTGGQPWSGGPPPGGAGPTTYRSAGGPAAASTGQVYGQRPAPAGGGVYGAAAPRPSGGVYGGAVPQPPVPGQPGPPPAPPAGSGKNPPPDPAGGDATTVMPRLPG